MLNGLLARKMGMTQIFQDDGTVLPVTVLQAGPMTVVQKKTKDKDGCDHVQVGFEEISERKLNNLQKDTLKITPPPDSCVNLKLRILIKLKSVRFLVLICSLKVKVSPFQETQKARVLPVL